MNKKGFTLSWPVIITMVLVLAVIIVAAALLFQGLAQKKQAEKSVTERFGSWDEKCVDATRALKVTQDLPELLGQETVRVDEDLDKRDDVLCDWCVCKEGCHNDADDKDGDKLPDICDLAADNNKTAEFHKRCGQLGDTTFGKATQCWHPQNI
ncbi:hypothetical protein ACFLZB_01710 [Nanoarchaeota archaeon]